MTDMSRDGGRPSRVLIAGVGYSFLRDWSIGPRVVAQLQQRAWPQGVDIDDWSFGPIDGVDKLRAADPKYDRVVFFGAVDRGRPVGSVVRRVWEQTELPDPETIQDRIGEAISGVISLDNLVWVCAAFDTLPSDVVLIEVQPGPEDTVGEDYSPAGEAAVPELVRYIEAEVGLRPVATGIAP